MTSEEPDFNLSLVFHRVEVLESTAEALVNSRLFGEVTSMSDAVTEGLDRAFGFM